MIAPSRAARRPLSDPVRAYIEVAWWSVPGPRHARYGDAAAQRLHQRLSRREPRACATFLSTVGSPRVQEKLGIDALSDKLPPDIARRSTGRRSWLQSDGTGIGGEPGEATGAMAPAQMGKQER